MAGMTLLPHSRNCFTYFPKIFLIGNWSCESEPFCDMPYKLLLQEWSTVTRIFMKPQLLLSYWYRDVSVTVFIQVPRVYWWSVGWIGTIWWCASEARSTSKASSDCSEGFQSGTQCWRRCHIFSQQGTITCFCLFFFILFYLFIDTVTTSWSLFLSQKLLYSSLSLQTKSRMLPEQWSRHLNDTIGAATWGISVQFAINNNAFWKGTRCLCTKVSWT